MRHIRLAAIVLLAACGDGGTNPTAPPSSSTPPAPVATTVALSQTNLMFSSLGETSSLSATVEDQNGATMGNASISWSSSSSSIATVSSDGLVTAAGNGSAIITAASGSASATATVTIEQIAITLALSKDSLAFNVAGDTLTLTATADDAGGSTLAEFNVAWSSSDTAIATVSNKGLVTALSDGSATITATSETLAATATVTIDLVDAIVSIASTDPTIWTEGQEATINGEGFGVTRSSNIITVDGLTAVVTSATETQLQITVPTAACKPSRETQLVVKVAANTATSTVGVRPEATVWDLNLGGGVYTTGADCIHLEAGSGAEKYIVGVFSTSETPSSLIPYTQTAIAGMTLADDASPETRMPDESVGYFEAPFITLADRPTRNPAPLQEVGTDLEYEASLLAHSEAELQLREADRRIFEDLGPARTASRGIAGERAATQASLPPRSVGDTIEIRVSNASCDVYDTINVMVRHVGTSGIYMEDLENPLPESFTPTEYADWDATFTETTLPKLTEYVGDRSDNVGFGLDDTGRVGIVLTKVLNARGSNLGFVNSADQYPRSVCPSSNYAELFYARVPDPDGVHGKVVTKESVDTGMPALLAHETAHIIQFTQSVHRTAAWKAVWELEGAATLMEWIVGNAVLDHGGAGQNIGQTKYLAGSAWYRDLHNDLARYFGYGSSSKVSQAPEECTWLERKPPGPCGGGDGEWTRAPYGLPALLIRFMLDLYGPSYPGGEGALMRAMWSSNWTGYNNLVTTADESEGIRYIQTLFGLNLYSDGREGVAQGTWTSALTYWDFSEIMSRYVSRAQLEPYTSSASEPTTNHSVRAGSTAYLEWSPPDSHAPTSLRIRTPDGDALPDVMGMWIFRIQ